MKEIQIKLYKHNDYTYAYGDFIPTINAYYHDDNIHRPAILIVPGGGYLYIAAIEAQIVAMKYYNYGYQAFVLTYSINTLDINPLKLQPLKDISRAICYIRKHADKFKIISNQIVACGFSAGGHLVGSLAVHYNKPYIKHPDDNNISNRPDAIILGYPVITTGKYGLDRCMNTLLGKDATKEEKEFMSLEKHVNHNTPPTFLWHTITDQDVPVENSRLFKEACDKADVYCELLLFPKGIHGMSLATEDCMNDDYYWKSTYTFAQAFENMKYGVLNYPKMFPKKYHHIPNMSLKEYIREYIQYRKEISTVSKEAFVDKDISTWLSKSIKFLNSVFK